MPDTQWLTLHHITPTAETAPASAGPNKARDSGGLLGRPCHAGRALGAAPPAVRHWPCPPAGRSPLGRQAPGDLSHPAETLRTAQQVASVSRRLDSLYRIAAYLLAGRTVACPSVRRWRACRRPNCRCWRHASPTRHPAHARHVGPLVRRPRYDRDPAAAGDLRHIRPNRPARPGPPPAGALSAHSGAPSWSASTGSV